MTVANRRVEDLQPYLQDRYKQLVEGCKKVGIILLLMETKRTQERQTEIFHKGTGPALLGPHGVGCAFDVAPIKNGVIDWDDYTSFHKMGQIGKNLGLEWGGDWKKRVDCPHFQWVGGLSDEELRAGELPKFPTIQNNDEGGFDLMKYPLQPVAKGMLLNAGTLTCCSEPSNAKKTTSILRKGINEPIRIYARTSNEGLDWYLVNATNPQWVAAKYVRLI